MSGKATGAFSSLALHKSLSHKQAMILAPGVSEISRGEQVDCTRKGLSTDPNKILGEKHSRIVATSFEDFCQE